MTTTQQPIPLCYGEIGDTVYWHDTDNHRHEGKVHDIGPDNSRHPSGSHHSKACGCHHRPWNYDTQDADR